MRARRPRARVQLGALLACLSVALLLSSCALFHRHRNDTGCTEQTFNGNAENRPPLKAPAGLNPPDATGEVKIPQLNEPQQARAKTEPCLDRPPTYVSEPPQPPVRRPTP